MGAVAEVKAGSLMLVTHRGKRNAYFPAEGNRRIVPELSSGGGGV